MVDLSKMSDDDLLAIYQQESTKAQSGFNAGPTNAPDHIAARSDYTNGVTAIKKDRANWQALQPTLQSLDRYEELNKDVHTGGLPNMIPGVRAVMSAANPKLQEMQSISGALQTHSVPQGQGATSDFERSLFARGVPTPDKQGPVNQSIANQMRAVNKQQADWLDFEDAFLKQNGHLNGAPEAWQAYLAANPYVTKGRTVNGRDDVVVLNPNQKGWREFFGQAPASKGGGSQGGGGPPPQRKLSPQEAAKLPPGTRFTGLDGVERVKH